MVVPSVDDEGSDIGRISRRCLERREEGGVGEVPQGTDHGLLRMGGTGAVYGRGGKRGALRANAAWRSVRKKVPKAMLRFIEREARM